MVAEVTLQSTSRRMDASDDSTEQVRVATARMSTPQPLTCLRPLRAGSLRKLAETGKTVPGSDARLFGVCGSLGSAISSAFCSGSPICRTSVSDLRNLLLVVDKAAETQECVCNGERQEGKEDKDADDRQHG